MIPNSNNDNEINVYCDWLTDNGQEHLADEIRFDQPEMGWEFDNNSHFDSHFDVGGGEIFPDRFYRDTAGSLCGLETHFDGEALGTDVVGEVGGSWRATWR